MFRSQAAKCSVQEILFFTDMQLCSRARGIIRLPDCCLQPDMLTCKTKTYEVNFLFGKEKLGLSVSKESMHCVYLVSCKACFLSGRGPPTLLTSPAVDKACRPRRLTWKGCCRGCCGTRRWPIATSPPSV